MSSLCPHLLCTLNTSSLAQYLLMTGELGSDMLPQVLGTSACWYTKYWYASLVGAQLTGFTVDVADAAMGIMPWGLAGGRCTWPALADVCGQLDIMLLSHCLA